jgi:hypothetical protein
MIKHLISNTNNIVLQTIPAGIISTLIAGREKLGKQQRPVPLPLPDGFRRNLTFGGGRINITNMMWMKIMDKHLI